MAGKEQPVEIALDMNAELAARQAQPPPEVDAATSTEIAARIGELMRKSGIDDEANPLAAEKIARDLEYQRQMEKMPQPEDAPALAAEPTTPELERLEQLQQEKDKLEKEVAKWKTYYGRSESRTGDLKNRLAELEARVYQIQPTVDVRQITGKSAEEVLTAGEIVNLLMSQSHALGNTLRQMKEEMVLAVRNPDESRIPADVEAELLQAHPWLSNLPVPQKERAMSDMLGALGRPVSTQPAQVAQAQPASLVEPARAQVRQAAFIEPSNKGSQAERTAIAPERQAFNDKVAKLKEALLKPGGSTEAASLLAALGAGAVDETQVGYLNRRR